jgi:hypothetical protein
MLENGVMSSYLTCLVIYEESTGRDFTIPGSDIRLC